MSRLKSLATVRPDMMSTQSALLEHYYFYGEKLSLTTRDTEERNNQTDLVANVDHICTGSNVNFVRRPYVWTRRWLVFSRYVRKFVSLLCAL